MWISGISTLMYFLRVSRASAFGVPVVGLGLGGRTPPRETSVWREVLRGLGGVGAVLLDDA